MELAEAVGSQWWLGLVGVRVRGLVEVLGLGLVTMGLGLVVVGLCSYKNGWGWKQWCGGCGVIWLIEVGAGCEG